MHYTLINSDEERFIKGEKLVMRVSLQDGALSLHLTERFQGITSLGEPEWLSLKSDLYRTLSDLDLVDTNTDNVFSLAIQDSISLYNDSSTINNENIKADFTLKTTGDDDFFNSKEEHRMVEQICMKHVLLLLDYLV